MAHMARAAGTDYAVAGGKTLIDGTAYSVVATREVENTQFISGSFTGSHATSITLENSLFDWDKYNVAAFVALRSSYTSSGSVNYAFVVAGLNVNSGTHVSEHDGSAAAITTAVTPNGNGRLLIKPSTTAYATTPKFMGSYDYIVVLEAKT